MRSLVEKVRYYEEAQHLAQLICAAQEERSPDGTCVLRPGGDSVVVVTGGGPGIMEAANRGAHDIGADNIGLNIVLPFEQAPNRYITPHLCFNFHYFALRKMHFLMRAMALVVFPGGYGTLDELFEVLTLIQTHKIKPIPVLLFGREYWERIIDFQAMVDGGRHRTRRCRDLVLRGDGRGGLADPRARHGGARGPERLRSAPRAGGRREA